MPKLFNRRRSAFAVPSLLRSGGALLPRFTVAPAISGTTAIGDVLTGTITAATASPGGGTVTYAWAWQRSGADIAGASGTTTTVTSYTVVAADGKANADDADVPLRLRVTATDSNGSRTVFSNVLNGPALATDNSLTLTAGDGATSGTNLLTNDEPAATAINAATFDGETLTLGVPLTLTDRGAITINADGTWSFNDDADFGDVLIGMSLDRTGTYTNNVGGTGTITVTVDGATERAYAGRVSNVGEFDDAATPTEWALTGTQAPTLTVNNMTRVGGAAGVARLEGTIAAGSSLHYGYMFTNLINLFSFDLAVRADGTTGNIGRGVAGGVDALRVYVEGTNIKARLAAGAYDQTLTIAKPSSTTFGVSVAVDPVSAKFSLTVSDGDSSAVTAQEVSLAGYTAPVISDLYLMETDGAIFALNLQNPAAVSPTALVTGLETFVGTTYHNAGPAFTAPGSLSLADAQTDATLDVSSGASGGETPYTWAVGSITGDWSGVTIDASGVITADTSDLASDGTAGALVTVTDARGLTASDTISVTITTMSVASIFAGKAGGIHDPSDLTTLWQDAGRTVPVTAIGQNVAIFDDLSGNGEHYTCTNVTLGGDGTRFWLDIGLTSIVARASRFGTGANPNLTVVVAFRPSVASPAGVEPMFVFSDFSANSIMLGRNATTTAPGFFYNGGNEVYSGTLSAGTDFVLVGTRPSGGNYASSQAFVNGAERSAVSSSNPTGAPVATGAKVNLMSLSTTGVPGRLYGALILIDTVTTEERAVLEAWAAERSGVTL